MGIETSPDGPHAKPLLLVVDDDPLSTTLAKNVLESKNYEILTANDGEEALAVFAEKQPEFVLLDVLMPKIDGFVVCEELRKLSPTVPILMMTGLTDSRSIERAFDVGATDFIKKPINWQLLVRRVQAMIRAAKCLVEGRSHRDSYLALMELTPGLVFRLGFDGRVREVHGVDKVKLKLTLQNPEGCSVSEVFPVEMADAILMALGHFRRGNVRGDSTRRLQLDAECFDIKLCPLGQDEVIGLIMGTNREGCC